MLSTDGIEEIEGIINSEVVKRNALSFSSAVTTNFVKYGLDGEIIERTSPCFYPNQIMLIMFQITVPKQFV